MKKIFKGDIVYTKSPAMFEINEDSYLIVENGEVKEICRYIDSIPSDCEYLDYTGKLIIPGFVDIHLHSSQFFNIGLGMDKELIPWLNTYTFPEEAKFIDLEYANIAYSKFVSDLIKKGTTSSVIYASIHKESTMLLMDLLEEANLRAYVGKVNMDRNTIDELCENTDESIAQTEEIILSSKSDRVKPIITPRFVPSCSTTLMKGLSKLAIKYNVPVQSHLSENTNEVEWVKELHPDIENYASVYNKFGLFGQTKTVMAHCIYTSDDEIELMKKNGVFAAHCALSNFNLSSGIMPVRKYLDYGVDVGLGSDISGGNTLSIPQSIVSTIQASKIKWLESDKELYPLSFSEVFYMATKGGGKFFGKVGSLERGYKADLLVIDDSNLLDINKFGVLERLQKYIYSGNENNIIAVYVGANSVNH
ncbi:guanine deaminase [Soehngenia saccharolytica]|nr:guanine deaminase [Soehngenia saccharolytica]